MGNSLEDYRSRIGSYLPSNKVKVQKFLIRGNDSRLSMIPGNLKFIVLLVVFHLTSSCYEKGFAFRGAIDH